MILISEISMHRRRFLKSTTALTLLTMTETPLVSSEPPTAQNTPWIDHERLEARNQNRSTVVCQHGIVCASQPLAAMAGIDVLKRGGNCVDAAIATNAVLGVTEPASNGIGGDLFAILWSEQDQRLYGLNASGRAPAAWNLAAAGERSLKSIPRFSPLSWSVPGCVSGWAALQDRFGRLGLAACLDAAIGYAQDGFPLSPLIADHFKANEAYDASWLALYHPHGKQPKYGEIFRNPQLAQSYRAIASEGAAAFYEGQIADRIVAKCKQLGGYITRQDLADHRADWVDPVSSSYHGWDVWEIPPNGQGIAALQILNLLEQFPIGELKPNSAEHLHLFIEAKKLAFEDRARFYADPEFAKVPVEWLISKDYARQRAKQIDPKQAARDVRYGDPPLDSDTVYLTVADNEGNMISFIQSLYNGFGSTICPDNVGFSIQNRGQAFSLDPEHANRLEPRKRPFHTIIPGFLTREGRPVMSFGVMGGDFQPQGHSQVLMNMIDFGMSPQQAGEQPRVAHAGSSHPWGGTMENGGEVELERGFPDSVRKALAAMGHQVKDGVEVHGGYQAIWREENPRRYFGGSDPRKDGAAIGY
jgi:gamma-glutamyltranspeptidase / glutathione hydrolase